MGIIQNVSEEEGRGNSASFLVLSCSYLNKGVMYIWKIKPGKNYLIIVLFSVLFP